MATRVAEFPLALWAVFFLVQTGRGESLEEITADECETVLQFLADLSRTAPFGIKTTEAPHYHRVIAQRRQPSPQPPRFGATPNGTQRPIARAARSVGDGNGFVFIDHLGQVYPSGFLPLVRGNVRRDSLVRIYRDDELFRQLRDPDALEGKCRACEFRGTCGGSRSRAYAATGSPFGSDPLCAYIPPHTH